MNIVHIVDSLSYNIGRLEGMIIACEDEKINSIVDGIIGDLSDLLEAIIDDYREAKNDES